MPLNPADYIDQLNPADPTSDDPVNQGDNQIRDLKDTVKKQFPNLGTTVAVTATAEELNAAAAGFPAIDTTYLKVADDLSELSDPTKAAASRGNLGLGDLAVEDLVHTANLADYDAAANPQVDGVTAPKISDKAVTTAKIDDKAVDTEQIADNAVETLQVADAAIQTLQLDDDAVTTEKIAEFAVATVIDPSNGSDVPNFVGSLAYDQAVPAATYAVNDYFVFTTSGVRTATPALNNPVTNQVEIGDRIKCVTAGAVVSTSTFNYQSVTSELAQGSVVTEKIADGSVTDEKLSVGFSRIPTVVYLTTGSGEYWDIPDGVTAVEVAVTGAGGGNTRTDSSVIYGSSTVIGESGAVVAIGNGAAGGATGGDLNISGGHGTYAANDETGGGSSYYGGPAGNNNPPFGSGGRTTGASSIAAGAGGTAIKRLSVIPGEQIQYSVGTSVISQGVQSGQGLIVIKY